LNKLFHAENISDISSITASSNGKILNVTFWLTDAFNEHPKKTAPEYYIRFDTDSNLQTGDKFGADYLFDVYWNNDTKTWWQIFQEYSPNNHVRVLQFNNNYTNFYSIFDSNIISGKKKQSDYLNCCYVSFPIDLKLMNNPNTYVMSFHIKDVVYVNQTLTGMDNLRKPLTVQVNGDIKFLDSTADISIPIPTFEFAAESEKINLTQEHKSAPIFINSISESPALIGLSVDNKTLPAKFISFVPNRTQQIEPHGRVKFDLVCDGDITNTSSFLLPINQSVYQRIDSEKPNELTYSSSPTITTSSLILYLTQEIESPLIDLKALPTSIITTIIVVPITVAITVVLTLVIEHFWKKGKKQKESY
jgi:hypothetical protein